jgi:uncharacterized membrane protein YeaQ/YmgE (transglycosylase-associated protein family)
MSPLLKILLAIVIGLIVTTILENYTSLAHSLDILLGIAAALVVYFYPIS